MTMIAWRVLCILSLLLFAGGLVALLLAKLTKNKYYFEFSEDELMRTNKTANSDNAIYLTSGETKKAVKKYVICQTAYDKFLVCNYAKKFKEITYFVVEYSAQKKVLSVKKVTERGTSDTSKVIALDRRCAYVNIIVGSVDEKEINTSVIRPLSLSKIRLYALLKSATMFFGLFVLRHFVVEIAGGAFAKGYLCDLMNYIAVAATFVFAVASYFITVKCFRKKNADARNGGVLEYEFV